MKIKRLASAVTALVMILGLFTITDVFATTPIITQYFEPADGEVIAMSVDVIQTGEGMYGIEFSSPKNINTPYDTGNMAAYGMVRIYNGQLLYRTNGGWIAPNQISQSGINTTKFTENEWHNIKLRVTRAEKLAELYLDDEYVGSMNLLNELVNPAHIVRVFSQGERNFELKFISAVGSKKGEMSAQIESVDTKNRQIKLNFSETPQSIGALGSAELNAVNSADGADSVSLGIAESGGSSAVLTYGRDLKPSTEYALVLPEGIMGKNGGILKGRYFYFTTDGTTETNVVDSCDYEDGAAKFSVAQPSGVEPIVDTDDGHGKAFYIRARKNEDDSLALNGFTPPTENVSSISFDIQPRRNIKAAIEILPPSASANPISIVFGESGYMLCKSDGVRDDSVYTQPNDENNIYQSDKIGTYTAKEWLTFKITFDKVKKIAEVSLNGKTVVTLDENKMSGFAQFDHVNFVFPAQGNVRTPLLYMDNIKSEVQVPIPFIENVRINDARGNSYGGAEVLNRLIKSVDIKFSADMDESALGADTIKLLYDNTETGYTGEYINADKTYRLYPDTLPSANAEITLNIGGAAAADGMAALPFVMTAAVDDTDGGLEVFESVFIGADGEKISELSSGDVYAKTIIANLSAQERKVLVSVTGYKDSTLKKYGYAIKSLEPGEMYITDESQNVIKIESSSIDRAQITVQDAETHIPLVSMCEIKRTNTESKSGEIKLSGETNGEIAIEMLAPNKSFSDLDGAADFREVLLYKTQVSASGKYECDFNIDYSGVKSGMYTVNVVGADLNDSYKILYVNKTDSKNVFDTLFKPAVDEKDAAKVGEVLLNNKFDLYLDDRYIDENIAERAAELIISNGVTFETAKTVINKAVAIAAFENGKIDNVLSEGEIFGIDNTKIADLYTASYVRDKTAEDIKRRLGTGKFTSFDNFDSRLCDAFILAVVKNPTEPGCIKTVLNKLGISAKNDGCYAAVSGNDYSSVDALKTALDKAGQSTSSSGGGSTGGGSNGGSSGGIKRETAVDIKQDNSTDETEYFEDTDGVEWAREAINALAKKSVINGKYDGHFCPNDNITREEFTKILVSALDIKGSAVLGFSDTISSMWYYEFISRAFDAGVVTGYDDKTFGIGQPITREDMAVMIHRGANLAGTAFGDANGGEKFADDDMIADYAESSVYALKNSNVINGREGNRFEPKAFATRAEAAKMIYNIMKK